MQELRTLAAIVVDIDDDDFLSDHMKYPEFAVSAAQGFIAATCTAADNTKKHVATKGREKHRKDKLQATQLQAEQFRRLREQAKQQADDNSLSTLLLLLLRVNCCQLNKWWKEERRRTKTRN